MAFEKIKVANPIVEMDGEPRSNLSSSFPQSLLVAVLPPGGGPFELVSISSLVKPCPLLATFKLTSAVSWLGSRVVMVSIF